MEWMRGGTFYHGQNILGISALVDPRGCLHQALATTDGKIFHMVRGSRSPHPVISREIIPEARAIGTPAISYFPQLGLVEIACPLEGVGDALWACPLAEIPDPSGDEPVPFA